MSLSVFGRGLLLVAMVTLSSWKADGAMPFPPTKTNLNTNAVFLSDGNELIVDDELWGRTGIQSESFGETLQSVSGQAAHVLETEISIPCVEGRISSPADINLNTFDFKYQPNTENANQHCKFFMWAENDGLGNKTLHLSTLPENGGSPDSAAFFSPANAYDFSIDRPNGVFEIVMTNLPNNHFRLTVEPSVGSPNELVCSISLSNGKLWMAQRQNETSTKVFNLTNGNSSKANHERDYRTYSEERQNSSELVGTPNPFGALLLVRFIVENDGDLASLTLFNADGRLAKQVLKSTSLPKGENSNTVATDDLPTGVYFLVAETNGKRLVSTVVKKE